MFLAARGMRHANAGAEAITDAIARAALRQTARKIQIIAPLAAVVLTTIALWAAG